MIVETLLLAIITGGILYMCTKLAVVNDISHEIRDILLRQEK